MNRSVEERVERPPRCPSCNSENTQYVGRQYILPGFEGLMGGDYVSIFRCPGCGPFAGEPGVREIMTSASRRRLRRRRRAGDRSASLFPRS